MNNEFKTNSVPIQWGCDSKPSRPMWLCIPEVEFRVRFSSIDATIQDSNITNLILLSGYVINIYVNASNNIFINSNKTDIHIKAEIYEVFLQTLNNCFSSK